MHGCVGGVHREPACTGKVDMSCSGSLTWRLCDLATRSIQPADVAADCLNFWMLLLLLKNVLWAVGA